MPRTAEMGNEVWNREATIGKGFNDEGRVPCLNLCSFGIYAFRAFSRESAIN